MKIKESDLSNPLNEVSILNHLSGAPSDHPGRIYSAASLLERHFWIDGPNGRHLALVCQVLGPSISRLDHWQIRLQTHLARTIALQVIQGLEYLHSEGICHGDLSSSNVLFRLNSFDSWTEYKLEEQLGNPRKSRINKCPARPRYLVDSLSFFDAEPGLLTKNITIVDHSESFFVKSPPSHKLHTTNHYAAPEVLCGWGASFSSDIWPLGCLIYELRSGFSLYSCDMYQTPVDAIQDTILRIGEFPSSWSHVQFNQKGYLERDGCEDPVDLSVEVPSHCCLHDEVDMIEDYKLKPAEINIPWHGSEPQGEIRNAFRKMHKSSTKPSSFPRTKGIYLTECSSTPWLVPATINKGEKPFSTSMSETESSDLTDLLSKILTWQPEDRLSLVDIKNHPWLTGV